MGKIKITPEKLRWLNLSMTLCNEGMWDVQRKIANAFTLIEDGMSNSSISNVKEKMSATNLKINILASEIQACQTMLNKAADSFQETDRALIDTGNIISEETIFHGMDFLPERADLNEWTSRASAVDYAWLSSISYGVFDSDNSKRKLMDKLSELPYTDPLKYLSPDQVDVIDDKLTGFQAIVIHDGECATVVFAGTNGDVSDYIADANLFFGQAPAQLMEAKSLIDELSKKYSSITVTGHSLGGYIASNVTLTSPNVSKCVAFEAPGQAPTKTAKDAIGNMFNMEEFDKRKAKITTYNAKGSGISWYGVNYGKTIDVDVEENWTLVFKNHGMTELYNGMGGIKKLKNNWD